VPPTEILPVTMRVSIVPTPETFKSVVDVAPRVENPETTNVEAVALPKVDTPALDNPVVLVCPNVVIPVTRNLAKSAPSDALTPPEALTTAADSVPVKVGDAENTTDPEPVSSVKAADKFDEEGVAKKVAMLAARPDTPVEIGNPVQLVSVPDDGVPRAGVTRVGEVANTADPEPVSSVKAAAKFDEEGVARNVATLAARPVILPTANPPLNVVAVTIPLTFSPPPGMDTPPENVENPETSNVEAVALPNVLTPALDNPVVLVCPRVVIPVTRNRAKSAP